MRTPCQAHRLKSSRANTLTRRSKTQSPLHSFLEGKMTRIARALAAVALFAAACTVPSVGAQDKGRDYPTRPIRIVIGIAPGGGLDTITRVAAQRLGERVRQTAVVDNRPGAGTVLAMDLVQQATPDGYTIMCASETFLLNGVLKRVRYD